MKNNEIYIVYNEFNATISTNGSHAKNNMSIANSLYLHVLLRICYMDIVKKIHCFLKPSFTVLSLGQTVNTIYLLIQISEHGTYMLILLSHSRVKVS